MRRADQVTDPGGELRGLGFTGEEAAGAHSENRGMAHRFPQREARSTQMLPYVIRGNRAVSVPICVPFNRSPQRKAASTQIFVNLIYRNRTW